MYRLCPPQDVLCCLIKFLGSSHEKGYWPCAASNNSLEKLSATMSSQELPPTPAETESTSLSKGTLSYRWIINDAAQCLKKFATLRSPSFSGSFKPAWKGTWHLVLQDQDQLALHSDLKGVSSGFLVKNGRFYILHHGTQEIFHHEDKEDYDDDEDNDEIMMERVGDIDNLLDEDTLSIQVEADILLVVNNTPLDHIHQDMLSLFKREVLTDTIIKCQGKEVKVHRAVLASRSPVFMAMFEADMKEKQSGVIEVSDITPEAMSDLVTYLYTGTAPNLNTLASELLEAAEKYQLPHLITKCENELGRNIKDINVVEMIRLADLHGRSALKKACLEFIRRNSANVFQTSEWADFKEHKVSLLVEVLENVLAPK